MSGAFSATLHAAPRTVPTMGTIAPPAILGSIPFAPEIVLSAMRHLVQRFPEVISEYRLPSGFNPAFAGNGSRGWISEGYFGLDQGIIVLMIENYRSQLIWKLMRNRPLSQNSDCSAPGLEALGCETALDFRFE